MEEGFGVLAKMCRTAVQGAESTYSESRRGALFYRESKYRRIALISK